ncbi:MarR family transcriptional regulator [Paenibacillus sp. JCM 10914]|uniref:MarR family winged helix-turn-helix transcriptional regulator n=1 Tax=Paenibacillus sp. JCM 10914 TaxID=1236974 RepID=UPI0003CCB4E6|nr:MarR family transcriptional regulator [Paenibacillus sp. JCM 10914]GAE09739.1 transcriptional regulator, MarR family [Paenibacillus sp. JCM 10914]
MNDKAKQWIDRYVDVHLLVTRRINAQIREHLGEDLTNDQFQVVRLINSMTHCTSSLLAEQLAVGKSSITAIINRLVDAGIIQRTRDESDRRIVYLSLTDYGATIFESAHEQVREIISPYLQHFEDKDIEMFISMFEKLGHLMQESGGRKN